MNETIDQIGRIDGAEASRVVKTGARGKAGEDSIGVGRIRPGAIRSAEHAGLRVCANGHVVKDATARGSACIAA